MELASSSVVLQDLRGQLSQFGRDFDHLLEMANRIILCLHAFVWQRPAFQPRRPLLNAPTAANAG
jgi:hypothetical protein